MGKFAGRTGISENSMAFISFFAVSSRRVIFHNISLSPRLDQVASSLDCKSRSIANVDFLTLIGFWWIFG